MSVIADFIEATYTTKKQEKYTDGHNQLSFYFLLFFIYFLQLKKRQQQQQNMNREK